MLPIRCIPEMSSVETERTLTKHIMGKAGIAMERKRIVYLDYLRTAAIFAVIMIHVAAQNWYSQDVGTVEWRIFNFYDSISRWSVAVFVMISGALMLEKEISLKKLYTRKIPHFLIVFLFWSLVYALVMGGSFETVLLNVVRGKSHLWFVYLIVGLYICIPVIRKIVEDRRVTECFLVISVVFSFAVPFLLQVLTDFGGETVKTWAKAFTDVYNDMRITITGGYAACYVAGYYLSRVEISKPARIAIYLTGLLGMAATVFLSLHISVAQGTPVGDYYQDLNLNVVVSSVAVFVWFRYHTPSADRINAIAGRLGACSFGIYLVHILILEALEKHLGLNTLSFTPALAVPVISVIVFAVSGAVAAMIRRIPVLKDYII